jgi:ATP-dependent Clp protease ATP-binding subunit ClpA
MMFERFTPDARAAVAQAQDQARRLGQPFIGGEHLLLALAGQAGPAGEVLRNHGVTPDRIEAEFARIIPGRPASALGPPEREALAAIGIDLDAVRARIETAFGPGALTRARTCRRRRPGWRKGPLARLPRRPRDRPPMPSGHLPFTALAKKSLAEAVRVAQAQQDSWYVRPEHLAVALTEDGRGLVPVILARLAVPAPVLRAALFNRGQQAS